MRKRRLAVKSRRALLLALSMLPCAAQDASQRFQTLYSFSGTPDGSDPDSVPALAIGTGGVVYGITALGGDYGSGTAYSLTPPALPGGAWTEAVLHSFGGPTDGALPYSGLAFGSDGFLYGTTEGGGAYGHGTVFSLAPPSVPGEAWTETVVYSFGERAHDGSQPYGTPVFGPHGVLYGTTTTGGPNVCSQGSCGTVFALAPPAAPDGAWTEAILYTFGATGDGYHPASSLLIGHDGSLYGNTVLGGAGSGGTVFRLTPPPSSGGEWAESILLSFGSGGYPIGDLRVGVGPVLYGTTQSSVYSLTPPATAGGSWTYAALAADLPLLFGGVALDKRTGRLYGTTFYGGSENLGSIFMLAPPASPGGAWTDTPIHSFTGSDGSYPVEGMLLSDGVLYGTTASDGVVCSGVGCGTVFSFVLAP